MKFAGMLSSHARHSSKVRHDYPAMWPCSAHCRMQQQNSVLCAMAMPAGINNTLAAPWCRCSKAACTVPWQCQLMSTLHYLAHAVHTSSTAAGEAHMIESSCYSVHSIMLVALTSQHLLMAAGCCNGIRQVASSTQTVRQCVRFGDRHMLKYDLGSTSS
jgi:hypothetical protein